MDFRTEISLEEMLAEPMVVALMKQDGVSIGEARALYVSVGQRLKEKASMRDRTLQTHLRPMADRAVLRISCRNACNAPSVMAEENGRSSLT